jgi:hypothetical protein
MPKSRGRYSSNQSRDRKPKSTQQIGPTKLLPLEENEIKEPNNGRLTAEQRNSVHEYIKYLMGMEKSGIKPTRKQPTNEDFEKNKRDFNNLLYMNMWKERNMRVPSLDDYFNEHSPSPSPSPSPSHGSSPGPSIGSSPGPSPTERTKSTPKVPPLLFDLTLPDIHDETPPISGGKSRRVFRRKMTSRRRQRRSTRSKHKH